MRKRQAQPPKGGQEDAVPAQQLEAPKGFLADKDYSGIIVRELGIKEDDVIVSVGGGGGAGISLEAKTAEAGARLIIVSKGYSTIITPEDMLDARKTALRHQIGRVQSSFQDYDVPEDVKGYYMFNVLDAAGTREGDEIVEKALLSLKGRKGFIFASTYLPWDLGGENHAYTGNCERILEIGKRLGIEVKGPKKFQYTFSEYAEAYTVG